MTAIGQTPQNTDLSALSLAAAEAFRTIGGGGNPAFGSPWVNEGGAYSTAAFRKLSNELVALRGVVKSGHNGDTIFTLPSGYRPSEQRNLWTIAADAGFSTYYPTLLVITTAGAVSVVVSGFSGATVIQHLMLDCVFVL